MAAKNAHKHAKRGNRVEAERGRLHYFLRGGTKFIIIVIIIICVIIVM